MSTHDEKWMRHALQLAKHAASQNEVPVGALLVHNEQLISEAWNQPIAHSDPSAHAEILALRQAGAHLHNYRLLNCTLYVSLEPCLMCLGAILHARIARLVFGAYDRKTGAVVSHFQLLDHYPQKHSIDYLGGCLADECGSILSDFFQHKRLTTKRCSEDHK